MILGTTEEDDDSQSEDENSISDAYVQSSNQPKIFVGSLTPKVTESQLEAYFSAFGRVAKAQVVYDRDIGRSRGFGFVTFADNTAFKKGVLKVRHFLNDSRLTVHCSTRNARSLGRCVRLSLVIDFPGKFTRIYFRN
ncbi:unnamed protein product [Dibothriocephalus latus]|uniref:RRM domain-containing protein n=1 Tax=Dibothriocephalus latus TaxID=60516 RepID=A0A3P7R1L6_DIBLA|nr:unnamed protein product [Dibothriocephalus latus]